MVKVFIAVGTHEVVFSRFFDSVRKISTSVFEVIAQVGSYDFDLLPKEWKCKDYLVTAEMARSAEWADILISQTSPGLISLAWEKDCISVSMPRSKQFKEHVDDHQMEFANFLEEKGGTKVLREVPNLDSYLLDLFQARNSILNSQREMATLFSKKLELAGKVLLQKINDYSEEITKTNQIWK